MAAQLDSPHLVTMGQPGLWRSARRADGDLLLPLSKPLALLTYLHLAQRHSVHRDQAVDLLWSHVERERGRQSLRQSVWQLRQRLGNAAIQADDQRLALAIPLSSDHAEYLAALREGDWARAIGLYAGPFLDGFAAPGAAAFESWADLQREHLAVGYRDALETATHAHLQAGRWREARHAAQALRDADPAREAAWRLLLEALLAGADRPGALGEALAFERAWAELGRPCEPATRRLLEVVRESGSPASTVRSTALAAELVGRSREFGEALEAWARARAGHGRHLRILGAAGMGKTRLLDDLRARLTNSGATVVTVRANPGERRLPLACAAELARALGSLPGAKGISEADASVLVGFVASLASVYRVKPDVPRGAEALRQRVAALVELLAAVAEEQPMALLVDDVHWADAESRTALSALVHRVEGMRVLVVSTERPLEASPLVVPATRTLELRPLSSHECEALMASLGALPAQEWTVGLGEALARSTRGSPLLLLETLRFAIDRGWLALGDGWRLVAPTEWQRTLEEGTALTRRIEALEAGDLRVLGCLAVAGTPVTESRLRAAVGRVPEASLARLQLAGLVMLGSPGWSVAHDEIAAATLRLLGPDGERELRAGIGRAIADAPALSLDDYPVAAAHLLVGGADERLPALFRGLLVRSRLGGSSSSDRDLARFLLGQDATEPRIRWLLSTRAWTRRLRPVLAVAAGVAALALTGRLAARPAAPAPGGIAMLAQPLEHRPTLVPDLAVEVLDTEGRRLVEYADTLSLSSASPWLRLEGGTRAVAREGVARFRAVRVVDVSAPPPEPPVFRITGQGLPALDWTPPTGEGEQRSGLWLERGTVNGQGIAAGTRAVRIAPGDSLRLDLILRYTSRWPAASVLLGGTTTWGDRERSHFTIKPLLTPVDSAFQHVSLALEGPSRPGRHAIILFFEAEDAVHFIASGTNWLARRPVWHDGNDVVDWTPAQLAEANRVGSVTTVRTYPPPVRQRDVRVPATVIDVAVEPVR
jgi:DNA-binding SARP family transcriptional activator